MIRGQSSPSGYILVFTRIYLNSGVSLAIFSTNGPSPIITLLYEFNLPSPAHIKKSNKNSFKKKDMVMNLHKLAESNALSKEREIAIQLLENRNSLSLRQIQEETQLAEDIISKI